MIYETNYPPFTLNERGGLVREDVQLPCYALEPAAADSFTRDEGESREIVEHDLREMLSAPGYEDVESVTVYNSRTGETLRSYSRKDLTAPSPVERGSAA